MLRKYPYGALCLALLCAAPVSLASAQAPAAASSSTPVQAPAAVAADAAGPEIFPVTLDGPPPAALPAMMARDDRGKVTVRAIKLREPLTLDGVLDEAVYTDYQPFGGLLQVVPNYLEPSTEKTDIWISYDATSIYVSAKCYDSAPPSQWTSNELRRDTNQLRNNDHLGVMFDTFYDRRSGFMFYTNPLGALADYNVVDEGAPNSDWNPVWQVRTGTFEGGWSVEMQIPFKTLRYTSGTNMVWGLQIRRSIRRKNEWTYLTPVPQMLAGPGALNRVSAAGTLVGLDLPPASRNMELKPYALNRVTTDKLRTPAVDHDNDFEFGGDFRYGITANLTADFTYNTDFAQVEVDEQQVNLTRFNLFFPEKRDFFLEGRGIFDFARGGSSANGGGSGGNNADSTPYLFFSRRIGLNRGREIPILGGGRVTGKAGAYGIGAVNIQTDDEDLSSTESTNFTVLRVKRDILRRSMVGAMFTNRNVTNAGASNQALGVDTALQFYQNVLISGYAARTQQDGRSGDDVSYQGKFDWVPDRYGVQLEHTKVGADFNPEVGFLRRTAFERSYAGVRFSPRPKGSKHVRKYTWQASTEYFENPGGQVETRTHNLRFNTEFHSSDQVTLEYNDNYDMLAVPFSPGPGVILPVGGYNYNDVTLGLNLGQQRRVYGNITAQLGQFFDGTLRSYAFGTGRVSVTKRFSFEPSVTINDVDVSSGSFTTRLLRSRVDYGFSPRMFLSALLQYNSADNTFSSNVRYRWEYTPGSELFLVWTDDHDTLRVRSTGLRSRAFVVKFNRLFRF